MPRFHHKSFDDKPNETYRCVPFAGVTEGNDASVVWHIYPLGFLGADTSGSDRTCRRSLRELINWLDYAVDLGVTAIALGPIFHSRSHGYDVIDYYDIDERLGTRADFDALLTACHDRRLGLILDGVFNHVSIDHPEARTALRTGDDRGLFTLYPTDPDPSGKVSYNYDMFEGNADLIELRGDSPAVIRYVRDVVAYWNRIGVDGWRLDAAYAKSNDFWHEVIGQSEEKFFFGEIIHGDYAAFVRDSTVHSATQYELWKAMWSSLVDRNFYELDHALTRHNKFLETFKPVTFLSNHDVTRIATTLDDLRLVAIAAVVQFTVGGIPMIYYGDEQGYRGTKYHRARGDEEVRPPFPDAPEDFAPWGAQIYQVVQDLIRLRHRFPWLATAKTETVALTNEQLCYRAVATSPDEAATGAELVVALNCAESEAEINLEGGILEGMSVQLGTGRVCGDVIRLEPRGWVILAR